MKQIVKKYAWLVLVAILVLVPLLSACGGQAPAPTPAPVPPPTTAPAPTPKPTPTPTATPHTLEGHADCLMCHETGVGEATKIPADHTGRTNDTCTTCHKPAA